MNNTISINELISLGITPALFWNSSNRDKQQLVHMIIPWSLRRGYNREIIEVYIKQFGLDIIIKSLNKHKDTMNIEFFDKILLLLKKYEQ